MTKDFMKELDQRLDENKRLSQGGVPEKLQPVATWLGLYPWQSLLGLSLVITVVLFAWLQATVVEVVERVLLVY